MKFNVFLIKTELWVHELDIIETGHIDVRFKHEVWKFIQFKKPEELGGL